MKLTKALLGICTALTVATAAHAKHIVLESQPLDKALTSLSIKTGAKVYWKAADVQNITIERTEGDDTKLKELLASLLSGTGLKATISADGQSVFIAKGNFMVGDVAAYPIIGASILDMQQSALLDKNNLQEAEEEDFDDSEIYYQLDELDVTANRLDNVRNVAMGVHKITAEEMLTIPTAFGEMDIIKVIQTLPGVKSLGEGTSGFSVRGGATDQNLVLFNDNTIYNPNHLFGFFSAINGNIVDNIELYKCNIPSQYGGRLSSVLDINSKRGNKQKFTGNASLGVLASSLNLEGPIVKDRTSLLLSARASYSDWILGLIPEKSGYKNGRAGFYDANLVLSHKFTSLDHLHVSGYYSHDRFKFEEGQKYAYCNANASAKYVHLFGGESPLEITGGFDHYDYSTSEYFNPYDADNYAPQVLETFPNKHPENEYLVTFNCPEFTTLCPKTGQPDFGKIIINYIPRERMVESKSLKLYLFSFRNHGDFHEDCVNIIMKDLVKLMDPKYLEVVGIFMPRGGISIYPFANYGDSEHQDMVRQRMLAMFRNQ